MFCQNPTSTVASSRVKHCGTVEGEPADIVCLKIGNPQKLCLSRSVCERGHNKQ